MAEKKQVGAATVAKLNILGSQLEAATRQRKHWADEETRLRSEISEITARYTLPIQDGKSEYLNLPAGNAVRITRPAAPTPKILSQSLYDLIHDRLSPREADRVFLDVYELPKYCTVNVERWRARVEDETLMNSMLRDALEVDRDPPKPNVQIGPTKKSD